MRSVLIAVTVILLAACDQAPGNHASRPPSPSPTECLTPIPGGNGLQRCGVPAPPSPSAQTPTQAAQAACGSVGGVYQADPSDPSVLAAQCVPPPGRTYDANPPLGLTTNCSALLGVRFNADGSLTFNPQSPTSDRRYQECFAAQP